MTYDGRAIANAVLDAAERNDISLSNLSLQKVLFFCHAWHLVDTGQPLIKHQFEAWQHGPVLQFIYRQFKKFERAPVTERATRMNPLTGETEIARAEIDLETLERIDRVVTFYGRLEPWDLVELSHKKGGPWDTVWNNGGEINPGMKIEHDAIKEFYSKFRGLERTQ